MGRLDELEHVQPSSRRAWRAWLEEHHRDSPGIWLVAFSRASGRPRLAYADIIEEALCFGWIDSRAGRVDAARSKILMTPRRPTSAWSKLNKERVARLEAAGLMAPRGLELVAAAKHNGAWDALNDVYAMVLPADLVASLDATPRARARFEAFPPSTKRGILDWIRTAKRPATRARRIADTARLAAENVRVNEWRPRLTRGRGPRGRTGPAAG